MDNFNIVCEECSHKFTREDLKFHERSTTVDGKKMKVVFYKCPDCLKVFVVAILDYQGEKLQNNYVKALDAYRKYVKSGVRSETLIRQKLEKVENLKKMAIDYQNEILHKYRGLIPEETFKLY